MPIYINIYLLKKNSMLELYKTQNNKVVGENKHGSYLQDIRNNATWLKTLRFNNESEYV